MTRRMNETNVADDAKTDGKEDEMLPSMREIDDVMWEAVSGGQPVVLTRRGHAGVVPRIGFEPMISALRGRCPGPLDERGANSSTDGKVYEDCPAGTNPPSPAPPEAVRSCCHARCMAISHPKESE